MERCKSISVWKMRNLKKLPEQTYPYSLICKPGKTGELIKDIQSSENLINPLHIKISTQNQKSIQISNLNIYSDGRVEFSITTRSSLQKYVEIDIRAIYSYPDSRKTPIWFIIDGKIINHQDKIFEKHGWNIQQLPQLGEHVGVPYLHRAEYVRDEILSVFVTSKMNEIKLNTKSRDIRENVAISLAKSIESGSSSFISLPNELDQYIRQVSSDDSKCDRATLDFLREMKGISEQIRNNWFNCISHDTRGVSYPDTPPGIPHSITRQQSCGRNIFSSI